MQLVYLGSEFVFLIGSRQCRYFLFQEMPGRKAQGLLPLHALGEDNPS